MYPIREGMRMYLKIDDECDRGVHGTNERITRRAYLQGVRFLIALLQTL